MVEHILIDTHQRNLQLQERTIAQRHEFALMRQADRLEKALRTVRTQLRFSLSPR